MHFYRKDCKTCFLCYCRNVWLLLQSSLQTRPREGKTNAQACIYFCSLVRDEIPMLFVRDEILFPCSHALRRRYIRLY